MKSNPSKVAKPSKLSKYESSANVVRSQSAMPEFKLQKNHGAELKSDNFLIENYQD
jgi:hypothetical protein